MTDYIAKSNTWFDAGTTVTLIDDYRPFISSGLFSGIRNGLPDEEICSFDEFNITSSLVITYPWPTVQRADGNEAPPFIPSGASAYKPKPSSVKQIARQLQADVDDYLTTFNQRQPDYQTLLDADNA